ncbi:hypothetical protein BDA99DRAFT_574047 [Phascolomyces articulosus]|uniref:Uncharacterized protein n=1 Tax=Phascolomyces articulosus TaxID=60185 RepID=A0AAD5JVP9_9FUNG|nr:hypothetical protein BDA99DRAFT_574047 [Phascolomyces articulosus]
MSLRCAYALARREKEDRLVATTSKHPKTQWFKDEFTLQETCPFCHVSMPINPTRFTMVKAKYESLLFTWIQNERGRFKAITRAMVARLFHKKAYKNEPETFFGSSASYLSVVVPVNLVTFIS